MGTNCCAAMSSNASLTGFRQKLVSCIEDLRNRREELNQSIRTDEMDKVNIENKLPSLSMHLSRSTDKIARLEKSQAEIDTAISEITDCNRRILEGFISRCMMPAEWMYLSAAIIWYVKPMTCVSWMAPERMNLLKSPAIHSNAMYTS